MKTTRLPFLLLCVYFLGSHQVARSQNYFKSLVDSDKYFNQKVTHFPNGDLLVGNSSVEALRTGSGGAIYMTRIDPCGNVKWSYAYERKEEYLEFKDFQINESNEVFIYGSAYIGLDELVFLLKLNGKGHILNFRIFEPETVDHFSYGIDLQGDRLMAYGLILDFGTKKHGFVAIFDLNLNFEWGVKFTPFESSGDAKITIDEGFICSSGPYLFKLNQDGELEWGRVLAQNSDKNITIISGPLEVNDGYVLEAFSEGYGFLYKVDLVGNFVWKSERFPSKAVPADMGLLSDGKLIATHSALVNGYHQVCFLELDPDDGRIIRHQWLNTGLSLKPGRVFQSLGKNSKIVISGNSDPFVPEQVDVSGFLAQFTWPPVSNDCFHWEDLPVPQPNEVNMVLSPIDTVILKTSMKWIDNSNITPARYGYPLFDACDQGPDLGLVRIDTMLACGEDWTVTLPSSEFTWADDQTENPRIISTPGIYQAHNQDCGALVIYEYRLEKPACACQVYLPTAFSPNQDGRNDLLEFFSA